MTLQSLVNTGIRATSSVPVKKIKVELMCNEDSIGSTVISLSTDRISSYTTTELIRHLEQACSDVIGGKYVPFMFFKRHNGSDTLIQISSDQEVADAISSGNDIVVEYITNEAEVVDDGYYKLSPNLLGSRGCPDRMLKAGGWVVPDSSPSSWKRGDFNSAVIRDMSFRNIQSNYVSIVGDNSTPKKYSLVRSSRSDQSLRINDLQAVFGSDYKWAIFAIYDRYGCNYDQILNSIVSETDLKVGNDGVVILPPPLYWNTETHTDFRSNVVINLDDISFTAENGKTYHAILDYNSYTTSVGSRTPTTFGWVAEGCKNFLELTHSELDILDNGDVSDLGLNEFDIEVYEEVENGHNVNYIYPSYYDSEDDEEISPTPGDRVVLARPASFEGCCIWESGNAVKLYNVEDNINVYVDTYYFDSTVKWFGVTKNGSSTHDTYGYGVNYGRSNEAMTKTRFISLFGLPQNTSDSTICDLFDAACDMYPVRISPAGYIILPPGFFWMNVTTSTTAANISFKDDIGRIWKFVSNEWSNYPELVDSTWIKQDSSVSNMVFSNYPLDEFCGVVTDKDTWNNFGVYWGFISDTSTNCCILKAGNVARWNYSSPTNTTPVSGAEIKITTESGEITLGWNSTIKCFLDTRMSVSSNKTINYGTDSNGNLCSVHEDNIESLPPGMVLVTKYTRHDGNFETSTDRNICYMICPVGWSWVNTTAGNYNVVDPRGITWTYGGTSGDDQHYWFASACKIYGTFDDDFRDYVFDNPSTTTVPAYSPGYAGARSTWPSSVEFSLQCDAVNFDVVEPDRWGYYRGDYQISDSNNKKFTKLNGNTLYIIPNSDWMVLAWMIPTNW